LNIARSEDAELLFEEALFDEELLEEELLDEDPFDEELEVVASGPSGFSKAKTTSEK